MSTTSAPALVNIDDLDSVYNVPSLPGDEMAHSTEACPEATLPGVWRPKTDDPGFLCPQCIAVTVRSSAAVVEAPRDLPTGGTPRPKPEPTERKPLAGASPAQADLIERLVAEKGAPAQALVDEATKRRLTKGRDGTASKLIDALFALPRPAAESAEVDEAPYRWTKVAERWLATGPDAQVGDTIQIRKGNGEVKTATVTGVYAKANEIDSGRALLEVRESTAPATAGPAPARRSTGSIRASMLAIRDRIVATTGAQTRDRCVRVCVPAEVLDVADQPDAAYLLSWAYAWKGAERHTGGVGDIRRIALSDASAVRLAEFLLAATDAEFVEYQSAYGRHFHHCGRCGSPLTDKTSKARGLGPDCATKG